MIFWSVALLYLNVDQSHPSFHPINGFSIKHDVVCDAIKVPGTKAGYHRQRWYKEPSSQNFHAMTRMGKSPPYRVFCRSGNVLEGQNLTSSKITMNQPPSRMAD